TIHHQLVCRSIYLDRMQKRYLTVGLRIEIQEKGLRSASGKGGSEVDCGGSLPDTAFLIGDCDNQSVELLRQKKSLQESRYIVRSLASPITSGQSSSEVSPSALSSSSLAMLFFDAWITSTST